jgi:aspartyl-tRNA(Asn)/glutamyl-tRNA(Gln) amidotransferase subunit A
VLHLEDDIAGLTFGVVDEYLECAREDVQQSFLNAVKIFESLGVKIVHVKMPLSQNSLKAYYVQSCVEAASNLARYDGVREGLRLDVDEYVSVQDMMKRVRTEGFGDEVKRRIIFGTYMSKGENYAKYHLNARNAVKSIINEFDNAFSDCDILISPTATTTAFANDFKFTNPVDGYKADICTVPVNMLGLCAVSVPCGLGEDGLPVGLQVIGNKFCEAQILNVAHKFEKEYSIQLPDMGVQL